MMLRMKSITKVIFTSILLTSTLAFAQDYSIIRKNSNVWVNECDYCHKSHQELAEKTGIRTEQYMFNTVYYHENIDGRIFGNVLSKSEIDFVARFVLIQAYLIKLQEDSDNLPENIRL